MVKTKYNVVTGLIKSAKNVAIVVGIPAVIVLLDNLVNWIPNEWNAWAMPLMGFVAYFVKNYIKNK